MLPCRLVPHVPSVTLEIALVTVLRHSCFGAVLKHRANESHVLLRVHLRHVGLYHVTGAGTHRASRLRP